MMPVSAAMRAAIQAPETDAAILTLITIEHAGLAEPLRVTSDAVDTVSRGQTHVPYPFRGRLADSGGDSPPRAQLEIDNVDRRIVEGVQALSGPPSVTIELVLADSPDLLEAGPYVFGLVDIEWDVAIVRGTLSYDTTLMDPWPARTFAPRGWPGLHPGVRV